MIFTVIKRPQMVKEMKKTTRLTSCGSLYPREVPDEISKRKYQHGPVGGLQTLIRIYTGPVSTYNSPAPSPFRGLDIKIWYKVSIGHEAK